MNFHSPFKCSFPFLCFVLASNFFLQSYHVSRNLEVYQNCKNDFSGGNITGIGYPFRGHNDPEYCGYPGLDLRCYRSNGDHVTRIEMKNMTYRVMDIHTQTMRVAREDVMEATCPTDLVKTTLDYSLFDYATTTSSLNLTFLYGCTYSNLPGLTPNPLPSCGANVYVLPGVVGPGSCNASVVYPVAQPGNGGSINFTGLEQVLREGFDIRWRIDSSICSECSGSNGRCGYDFGSNRTNCYCPNPPYVESIGCSVSSSTPSRGQSSWLQRQKGLVLNGFSIGIPLIISSVGLIYYLAKRYSWWEAAIYWKSNDGNNRLVEEFMRNYGSIAPKQYTYSEIKKMTNSFADKLGHGGYGCVYRGKLSDGRLVAVKVLNDNKGNGQEFINEVATISRTSHVNVVTLLGFCYNRNKRALIYEFMPNGSLDKFICKKGSSLDITKSDFLGWKLLYEIAVGIARGLEYLHRGCNSRIVHFDIKPQNILLDAAFCPKISDFGLAKLCQRKESVLSTLSARGTIGYIAPEVFLRNFGGVSHKSDVYSYGMMVIEMVGLRRKPEIDSQQTSENYFPNWIYEHVELDKELPLEGVRSEDEEETARKMILVGLWCIQTYPADRPSISKVVEMLEGSLQSIQLPPKPFQNSPAAINSDQESWTTSSIS